MAFTHSIGVTYKTDEGTIANTLDSFTGDAEQGLDVTIPASSTIRENVQVYQSEIVSFCLWSKLALTVGLYKNNSLVQTISLGANKQLNWDNGLANSNPITADFDSVHLTNPSITTATAFKARFLLNAGS